jgi:hypothetical protein
LGEDAAFAQALGDGEGGLGGAEENREDGAVGGGGQGEASEG